MATPATTADTARELARKWDAGWAARDPHQLAEIFTEDGTWEDPILARPIVGKGDLERYFESMLRAIPDIEITQEEVFTDVDESSRVGTRWRLRGTFRGDFDAAGHSEVVTSATGDRLDFTGFGEGRLRDGQLSHLRQYVDYTTFQRQIGFLPPTGSFAERILARFQKLGATRRRRKNANGG